MFTQLYTLKQSKRGQFSYNDKRYLLANLANGKPNQNTYAYRQKDFAVKDELVAHVPDGPATKLLIERREERFRKKHTQMLAKVADRGERDSNGD